MISARSEYVELLDSYLNHSLQAEDFKKNFIHKFKSEERDLDEPLFLLLDGLFGDVDSFTTDKSLIDLNPAFYLGETGLREKVVIASLRLSTMSG